MGTIYEIISKNPNYFAWVFGVVNVIWGLFIYFNKQRHDRELKSVQHELNLDLERRKKVFELKISKYESYVRNLDEFGRKYQSELFIRMLPTFQKYMDRMLAAENDKFQENLAISQFSMDVMELMNESMAQYYLLNSESRSLKLTASESLLKIFEELEALVEDSLELSKKFINELPLLIISGDQNGIQNHQILLNEKGESIKQKSKILESQMRTELNEI